MRIVFALFAVLLFAGCKSRSVLSDASEVKVTRDAADKKCREIGKITGSTSSVKGTQEQALEDLKKEAANKGANFVTVKEYSSYGTGVTGMAYECP